MQSAGRLNDLAGDPSGIFRRQKGRHGSDIARLSHPAEGRVWKSLRQHRLEFGHRFRTPVSTGPGGYGVYRDIPSATKGAADGLTKSLAAELGPKPLESIAEKHFDPMFDLNVRGPVSATQATAGAFGKGIGSVVNIWIGGFANGACGPSVYWDRKPRRRSLRTAIRSFGLRDYL